MLNEGRGLYGVFKKINTQDPDVMPDRVESKFNARQLSRNLQDRLR